MNIKWWKTIPFYFVISFSHVKTINTYLSAYGNADSLYYWVVYYKFEITTFYLNSALCYL